MAIHHTYVLFLEAQAFPELTRKDLSITIKYIFTPREEEYFNYVEGVGSPGYAPSAEILSAYVLDRQGKKIDLCSHPRIWEFLMCDDVEARILEAHGDKP